MFYRFTSNHQSEIFQPVQDVIAVELYQRFLNNHHYCHSREGGNLDIGQNIFKYWHMKLDFVRSWYWIKVKHPFRCILFA